MKTLLLTLLSIVFCSISLYANEKYEGKIILTENNNFEATDIIITRDEIYFKKIGSSIVDSISTSDVKFLKVKDGTYLTHGLLLGAIVGYGIYYGVTPSIHLDTQESIYFAFIGLALGGIAGEMTTKTKTLKLYDHFYINISMRNKELPLINIPNFQILNFSVRF